MLNNPNNSLNTSIGGQPTTYTKSSNLYYNIFSKKMEELDIPDIDLEFNSAAIPENTTFFRAG